MNQVALVGRITKDPILRRVSEGRVQSSFILAVNRNFKNKNGEVEADFVLCTTWGRLAENTARHCGKGSLIGIVGRLQSRTYEREDKSRVYVTEVVGEDIRFLSTKRRGNENLYGGSDSTMPPPATSSDEKQHFQLPKHESDALPIF